MKLILTEKQIEILNLINGKNTDGSLLDLTQLRNSLSYTASKQAILASINSLVGRSLIERTAKVVRNSKICTTLAVTSDGEALLSAYTATRSYPIEDFEIDSGLLNNIEDFDLSLLDNIEDLNFELSKLDFDFPDIDMSMLEEMCKQEIALPDIDSTLAEMDKILSI